MPRKIYNFVILSKLNLAVKYLRHSVFGDVIKFLKGQTKDRTLEVLTEAKNYVLKVGKNKNRYAEMFLGCNDP